MPPRLRETRVFHLGRGPARLRAARAAQRSQEIHRTVPRRPTVAPHQPRAQHAVLTCEQARSRAITIIAATKNGEDPAARRDADRQAITVKELADRFDREHIALRLKPSTAKGYRRMLERVRSFRRSAATA